jgi:hypothetical protein
VQPRPALSKALPLADGIGLSIGKRFFQKPLLDQCGMAERVGFEPTVRYGGAPKTIIRPSLREIFMENPRKQDRNCSS